MNNEEKVRCEHTATNWSCRDITGELVSCEIVLTGQINLETNEVTISDTLKVEENAFSNFAIQNIHEIMSKDLEAQLRN